jgi:hypothetical protein
MCRPARLSSQHAHLLCRLPPTLWLSPKYASPTTYPSASHCHPFAASTSPPISPFTPPAVVMTANQMPLRLPRANVCDKAEEVLARKHNLLLWASSEGSNQFCA